MSYFTAGTLKFLADLEKNNDRAWFEKNKPRYEELVKEPAARLIGDTAPKLGMDGKMMRIHRDVRFSKDKSPYKTNVGIAFHPGGAKGGLMGGVYLHVTPKESFLATGAYQPEPPVLAKIRDAIAAKPQVWAKVRKVGVDEDETALKTAPKGFDAAHPHIADLRKKSFTASVDLTPKEVTSDELPRTIVAAEKKLRPLNDFLLAAIR